jgi:hypothetical protein
MFFPDFYVFSKGAFSSITESAWTCIYTFAHWTLALWSIPSDNFKLTKLNLKTDLVFINYITWIS